MPGFYINNVSLKIKLDNFDDNRCEQGKIEYNNFYIARNTLSKFLNDKLFFETDEFIIVLEGIIFNKNQMMENFENWEDSFIAMVCENPNEFFIKFRGMFSGAVYNKTSKEWNIFTDQLGAKAIFYYLKKDVMIIGSQLNYITDTMKAMKIERSIDLNGFKTYMMYGSFIDNRTGIKDIKRLYPGEYIKINSDLSYEIHNYYNAEPEVDYSITEKQAIDKLDIAFKQAIKRAADKNEEYNYVNVLDISGGLDSRMSCFVAKELDIKNAIMMSYSQSGSDEEKIAQKVANTLKFDYYHKSMDNASFLYEIDEILKMNSGCAFYFGITGGKQILETLSYNTGIEFTGLLGDIHDGSMIVEHGLEKPTLKYKSFSLCNVGNFEISTKMCEKFKRNETMWLCSRGIMTGMSTFFTRQNFLEPFAPFGDVEFLETYLSIPWGMRVEKQLLLRWMLNKYPSAGEIKYSATGVKASAELTYKGKLQILLIKYCKAFQRKILKKKSKNNMNPLDYWYATNTELRLFINEYFEEGIVDIQEIKIREELIQLFHSDEIINKLITISLIGYYNNFIK